jgi:cytochrome c
LASADPARGEKLALLCKECHSVERNSIKKNTPPLWGIVGRPKASVAGIRYSEALKALAGTWTYGDLNQYIAQPAWTAPGVAMKTPGIHEAKDRADIIIFLRSLSESPEPLP